MEKRDFFISYTKSDKAWASWVAGVLNANGYSVYMQESDIKAGDNFIDKMNEFLKNSANFIAVWSSDYAKSRYGKVELQAAFREWLENRRERVLIVRIEDYSIEPLYGVLSDVDLFGMERIEAAKTLETSVRRAIQNPAPELYADALYQRGDDYYYGRNGVTTNYAKAREYYEQAAAKGHADALFSLGVLYDFGQGVAQNYVKAREHYEQAAMKGNADALNNLGFLYNFGRGVEQDYIKAREHYEQAAIGNVSALYNLGVLYEKGQGVVKDYAKALEYFQKAADIGDVDAPDAISRIRKKMNGESHAE